MLFNIPKWKNSVKTIRNSFQISINNQIYRFYAKTTSKTAPLAKFRNIGIIAHVDAGKTTTCERMLYYSGVTERCGDVDSGDTVMDHLDMERERGITITSAVITFQWNRHTINVIDTPGHVDFTIEVERSVRVLDGAVVIIDAVSGVQAQTETVWNQAKRNEVPAIVFINKMDRDGASFTSSIQSLEKKLYVKTFPIQMPVSHSKNFSQIVDLIAMEILDWDDDDYGYNIERSPIEDEIVLTRAQSARDKLLESIANYDDVFMDLYLTENNNVSPTDIKAALKRITQERKGVIVLCGSSLKNKGVHPILDCIVEYLPSPLEKQAAEAIDEEGNAVSVQCDAEQPLCALAFKVVNDKKKGMVTYLRVYAGTLKIAQKLFNTNVSQNERPMQLFRIKADDIDPITEVRAGDIAAALGLKYTRSGDTLIDSHNLKKLKLKGMIIPKAVFFVSIFPDSPSDEVELNRILECIQLEDPSIEVTHNSETGQLLLCAQGELHMEIIRDRLFNHYKAKASMGDLEIAYRASIGHEITREYSKTLMVTGGKPESVTMTLTLSHSEEDKNVFEIDPKFDLSSVIGSNKKLLFEVKEALIGGADDAFRNGVPSGFQFHDLTVTLRKLEFDQGCSAATIRNVIWMAILNIANESEPVLVEPVMSVDIQVAESHVRSVISDFSGRRRGAIHDQTSDKHVKFLKGKAPLKELLGYASDLRSMTKGTGFFSMEFEEYQQLPEKLTKEVKRKHGYICE
jgi:elongation factor G